MSAAEEFTGEKFIEMVEVVKSEAPVENLRVAMLGLLVTLFTSDGLDAEEAKELGQFALESLTNPKYTYEETAV